MRLSKEEQLAIKGVLSKFDPNGKVYLFGSRVDNLRRGGDIDLLFETERTLSAKEELQAQYQLELACDVHVDLLVKQKNAPSEPIHTIALNSGVAL
jgi:predicted nucleotidyltransferase